MIKHTQAICQQQQTTYLSVFGQFELLALKGLQEIFTPLPSCTNIFFFFALHFSISNQGWAPTLKVTCILYIFRAQGCLKVAY